MWCIDTICRAFRFAMLKSNTDNSIARPALVSTSVLIYSEHADNWSWTSKHWQILECSVQDLWKKKIVLQTPFNSHNPKLKIESILLSSKMNTCQGRNSPLPVLDRWYSTCYTLYSTLAPLNSINVNFRGGVQQSNTFIL